METGVYFLDGQTEGGVNVKRPVFVDLKQVYHVSKKLAGIEDIKRVYTGTTDDMVTAVMNTYASRIMLEAARAKKADSKPPGKIRFGFVLDDVMLSTLLTSPRYIEGGGELFFMMGGLKKDGRNKTIESKLTKQIRAAIPSPKTEYLGFKVPVLYPSDELAIQYLE